MPLVRLLHLGERRVRRALDALVPDINALEPEVTALDDDGLRAKTTEFRGRVARGEDLDDLLVEAFAVVREGARRVLGQRPYDVQLVGGAALHAGMVAEMRTGEGKTLAAALPAYLNALAGDGVHIVTANDYLARRDAATIGRVQRALGLEVGLIVPGGDDATAKRAAYRCDITYGTTNEFGFDYLRDHMAADPGARVQRGRAYAIVDEVDSILIDEARTPLVISGTAAGSGELYRSFAEIVDALPASAFEVDLANRQVWATEEGLAAVEAALGVGDIYAEGRGDLMRHLRLALEARALFERDRDYIVGGDEVRIVDEHTGRTLAGRRWSEGLHQAIEAKEGLAVADESVTLASITLQNYFRGYAKLAGMTGTAASDAAELHGTYGLTVVEIPTHRPVARVDYDDVVYLNADAKYAAVVAEVARAHATGQPVLVGTASVAHSERLSGLLEEAGVPHAVLNAKAHAAEAAVIAQAGRLGAVTVATNMAGRGVDILLGGNPEALAAEAASAEGCVPDSAPHAARVAELLPGLREQCQAEGDAVRERGGLYVLGTERHESRRIDNQLRGRAGRQGDPGESQFFLALDDEIMALFATGALEWAMGRTLDPAEPLQSRLVSRAVERAQTTLEGRNAAARKQVLDYDDVLDAQRRTVYALRDGLLDGEDTAERTRAYASRAVGRIAGNGGGEGAEVWEPVLGHWLGGVREGEAERGEVGDAEAVAGYVAAVGAARWAGLEAAVGAGRCRQLERELLVGILDKHWRWHLEAMDDFRAGVHLRALAQADPLVAWSTEAYQAFEAMVVAVEEEYLRSLWQARVVDPEPAEDPAEAAGWVAANAGRGAGAACACGSGRKVRFCHPAG